ncbi:UDP-glucosyltransferase 2-like [Episyrphus balteatus]|uniref:UDP-glucosyltransferase 2-like n=1 Tax=Episyrphus balteatus TaxID=286459 RepID=UPI002485DF34|nr:UDP-glucosyltransferase 2-like [Episyrphus balteatus]
MDNGLLLSEKVLQQPIIQNLLTNPNRTFDLIICELFLTDALFGFGQHYNAPVIVISPMGNNFLSSVVSGTPMPPSFVPNILLPNTDRMNFIERALNLVGFTFQYLFYYFYWLPYQSSVYKKYFTSSTINLEEAMKNISLVLHNQHFSYGSPQPLLQNIIEVGGLHIQRQPKPLPLDIQKFLDDAHDGAIYFSLGSTFKSSGLSMDKLEAILQIFSTMKQRILWKFEVSSLKGKSDNILLKSWFPQNDVLAHPNIKLFITHGGMLGITEAIYHAKPVLAIPINYDQFINVAKAVKKGYALKLPLSQLTEDKFNSTLMEMLTNTKFSLTAKQVSSCYRDQPLEPLENAIYWIEYVIRHKGAPQLRSNALDLNFIQYHSLDSIFVIYGGLFLVLFLLCQWFKNNLFKVFRIKSVHKRKIY